MDRTKRKLNRLIEEHHYVMIEQRDGRIYFLKDHHKYMRPERQCPRTLYCKGKISEKQFEYLTHKFT